MRARRAAALATLLALLVACGRTAPEPALRPRELVLEGEVRHVVDAHGVRVAGADQDDRGVLVVLVERRRLRHQDRVRVVGEQRTLIVDDVEERFDVDLDDARYRPLEGEDVVVARTLVVLARSCSADASVPCPD